MKVLLTNDDGVDAEGILAISRALRDCGNEVWTVAPAENKSGASCSVSMDRPLSLEKRGENVFALDGTPVDCVLSALKGGYLPSMPDVVVSGINLGENMGTDVVYSGTCGAARQACLCGVPGIALSVVGDRLGGGYNFSALTNFVSKNLEKLIGLCGNLRNKEEGDCYTYFVNVNSPSSESYRGVRFAGLSRRDYHDRVEIIRRGDGKLLSQCLGGGAVESFGDDSSDYALVRDGYIAVSVLYVESVVNKSYKDGWF